MRITVDRNTNERAWICKVWNVGDADPEWGLIIGDCIHNARSALDHVVYQLAIVGLGRSLTDAEARKPQFPVFRRPSDFSSQLERLGDLRPEDVARLELLQPYHAWDESIWGPLQMPGPPAPIPNYTEVMTALDNSDKHRTVHPAWVATGLVSWPASAREWGITGSSSSNDALSEGAEIGRFHFSGDPPDVPSKMDMNAYFPVQISLWQPFFGTGVFRILSHCLTAATMVLDMFEPVIVRGALPSRLLYWDGGEPLEFGSRGTG